MIKLVTGTGSEVTSADDAAKHMNTYGSNDYMFYGNEPELIMDNTTVPWGTTVNINNDQAFDLRGGEFMVNGRHIRNIGNTEFTVRAGISGMTRIDLLVVRYVLDEEGVETARLEIVEGEERPIGKGAAPTKPAIYNTHTIAEGGNLMPNGERVYDVSITQFYFTNGLCTITKPCDSITPLIATKDERVNGEDVFILKDKIKFQKGFISQNKVLWEGAFYMNAAQSIDLPERISEQPNGIVLSFCTFENGVASDNGINSFFVSKEQAKQNQWHVFHMTTGGFGKVSAKTIKISDSKLQGNEINSELGTAVSGIKYNNNYFVLRTVIGV